MPLALVVSVSVAVPFKKMPLADPEAVGALNVTATPLTGLEAASSTVATSGTENEVSIAVLCGVPLVAAIDAGAPAEFVRLKLPDTGPTAAVTV